MNKILISFFALSLTFSPLVAQTGDSTLIPGVKNGSDTLSLEILTKIMAEVTIRKEGRGYFIDKYQLKKGLFGKQIEEELSKVPEAAVYAHQYVRLYIKGSALVAVGIAGIFAISLSPAIPIAACQIMFIPEGLGFVDLTRKGDYLTKAIVVYNRVQILQRTGKK